MLVLSRKPGERIFIGSDIKLTVVDIQGNRVKLAIDAPRNISVMREELIQAKAQWLESPEHEALQRDKETELQAAI